MITKIEYNEAFESFLQWMSVIEGAINTDLESKSPSSFEDTFCDGNQLHDYYWNSDVILVKYMLGSGEIVSKIFEIKQLLEWLNHE